MKKFCRLIAEWLSMIVIFLASPFSVTAVGQTPTLATPNGLSIAEIKVTGDEFLMLQNNTAATITDLSSYWLYDFNSVSPLSAGVSSSQQQLPAVALDPGQTLLLSSTTRNTCGAEVAGKLNVSLTDGGGFLEIIRLSQDNNGVVQQTSGDAVSWSSGASGIIQNVPTSTKDPQAVWYRYQNGAAYPWQQADVNTSNVCQLDVIVGITKQPAPTSGLLQTSSQPPATIVSVSAGQDDSSASSVIPASDIGLTAPQITELLPNPVGTDDDDTDEFIELYNSNDRSFDLSGFVLQTGITTKHSYTFPSGILLPAKSFVSFYSAETGLSLSNTSGQAALLDPLGNPISQSDAYGTAKDGQAWALANGKWYWTTQLTPSAANVVKQPATATTSKSSKSSSKKSTASVKGASTSKTGGPTSNTTSAATTAAAVTPIHPWTLAVVALLAVAYGLYEYRLDLLANRFYRLKRHRTARRTAG